MGRARSWAGPRHDARAWSGTRHDARAWEGPRLDALLQGAVGDEQEEYIDGTDAGVDDGA